MLSLLATGLGLLLKAMGLVSWGEALLKSAQDRKAGMDAQKLADDQATIAAAEGAARAQAIAAGQSDAAVTAALEKDVVK